MRIDGYGRVNRDKHVKFQFDGRSYDGFEGDTLTSALMAADVKLLGRSFKYHRPRGVLSLGSEEPNALVTVGEGAQADPNRRATVQEIYNGLIAKSQNRWPSLGFDILAMNDLLSPFLGAGFYYKTFMWPAAFWEKLYEPIIRRAAGLGALSGQPNPDRYEKAFAHCDVLVIGSGPTGLMAALTSARAGLDVILAEEDRDLGGRLLYDDEDVDGLPGHVWVEDIQRQLTEMDNVRIMTRTAITGAYDQGTFGALERVSLHRQPDQNLPQECFWRIQSKRTILAAGALERPVAFRNNDRPGVMLAGALRGYLNRYGTVPGKNVAIFGNNDGAFRAAQELAEAGLHVSAYVDVRHDAPTSSDFPVFAGAQVCNAHGRAGLEAITIRTSQGERRVAADCLGMSGGWNPSVHLTCHTNARPIWSEDKLAFLPIENSVPGLQAAGAARGIFDTKGCLEDGIEIGQSVVKALGRKAANVPLPDADDAPYRPSRLWAVEGKGRAWLDFQNDVTVKDVKQAAQENFRSVEHMKRYTTQGMATDQGKNSNVAALAVLADATGRSIAETGTTTFRPPFTPVSIAAMGAGAQGIGFAPQRFTTSHAASVERGAPMIEAGLWYRPSYFPATGETNWRQSCDREVQLVREAVGICDVSTLGKIDIQGSDAAAFLDFVYTNTFSTLKVGRVRYGLMLREDGHVMDDGTTARLGENHYLMTTTTAAAGLVMRHLDWVHQALCPKLDLRFVSVTEQWAQFAVAGPKSRELLNALLDSPLTDEDWPFMSCGDVSVMGVSARLFRISFSGEHAYEIAVPARYGDGLYRALVSRAEAVGGGPYGMEALNVLRIEKGFITHAEIHGRVTAFDVGMQGMVSKKKDCIGKAMSVRPGLMEVDRERLVGLRPVGEVRQLTAGAHLFDEDCDATRENDLGYITSVGFSPSFGEMRALGFLRNGPDRIGDRVKMVDHLRSVETICEVVEPVAFDPEGGRMRG